MTGTRMPARPRLPPLVVLALLSGSALEAHAEQTCPLDRTIFKDEESGREFVAQKVAVDYQYACAKPSSASDRHYSVPQKKLETECQGPYGKTIVEGLLDGAKAYAVYSVEMASPCCAWYSYSGNDKEATGLVKQWLHSVDVPVITLGDEWYTIRSPDPPFPPDQGPVGSGRFVPTRCR
jgi:hypothetical protein